MIGERPSRIGDDRSRSCGLALEALPVLQVDQVLIEGQRHGCLCVLSG